MHNILIDRAYTILEEKTTYRVLIDRLWPRGISKITLQLDDWIKEVAPSNELRKAVHSGDVDWETFDEKYRAEIAQNPAFKEVKQRLLAQLEKEDVTFITGAKLHEKGHPYVLRSVILSDR